MQKIKKLYEKYKEIIKYLIFGVLATVISLAVKYSLLFTIFDAENALQLQISVIASWIIACAFAYITNRIWVFESKSKNIILEVFKFYSLRLATLGAEMLILYIFITALGLNSDIWVVVWTLFAQVVVTIGNYVLSKLIVFRKEK